MKKISFLGSIFLFVIAMLWACRKTASVSNGGGVISGTLISAQLVRQVDTTTLKNYLQGFYNFKFPPLTTSVTNFITQGRIKDSVEVYRITYQTTLNGAPIIASGAILLPENGPVLRLASYQHSTFTNLSDAPSNYGTFDLTGRGNGSGFETIQMPTMLATDGYIVSCPDYIGFGVTSNLLETYVSKQTATTAFDMLQATKEFMQQRNIQPQKDSIALFGYSEGGYVTMALHQVIESKTTWPVSLEFAGNGPYDISSTTDSVLNKKSGVGSTPFWSFIGNYALLAYSLVYYSPYASSLTIRSILNQPYATTLPALFQPIFWPNIPQSFNISDIPSVFFNPALIQGYFSNTGVYADLRNFIISQDVYNWKPKYPVTLFASSADSLVFWTNSDSAYTAIKRNGGNYVPLDATQNINYLYSYPSFPIDHFSGYLVYLSYYYSKFAL